MNKSGGEELGPKNAWNENALHPFGPPDEEFEILATGMPMIGISYEPPRVRARREERARILAERQQEQDTNPDQPKLT